MKHENHDIITRQPKTIIRIRQHLNVRYQKSHISHTLWIHGHCLRRYG
jgi:hypothetical protein